jgi:hypothetical protein
MAEIAIAIDAPDSILLAHIFKAMNPALSPSSMAIAFVVAGNLHVVQILSAGRPANPSPNGRPSTKASNAGFSSKADAAERASSVAMSMVFFCLWMPPTAQMGVRTRERIKIGNVHLRPTNLQL